MCLYHKITHMSDEELEWATNCHEGELLYFQSSKGEYDTIQISKIEIWISKTYFIRTKKAPGESQCFILLHFTTILQASQLFISD